jgi:DNA-binding response OmpR family regulator
MARILIVDDDPVLLKVAGDYLKSRGHDVARCEDPNLAPELAEKLRPDLAILDYQMPGLTGAHLLTELRRRVPEVPVLFLSGVDAMHYASQIPPDPRVRFLRKPADFSELEGAISALLDPDGWSQKT